MCRRRQQVREITGTVSAIGATTITVGGATVSIARAEVHGALGFGATVTVHVTASADSALAARELDVLAPAPAAPVADDHGQDGVNHDAGDDKGHDGGHGGDDKGGDD